MQYQLQSHTYNLIVLVLSLLLYLINSTIILNTSKVIMIFELAGCLGSYMKIFGSVLLSQLAS